MPSSAGPETLLSLLCTHGAESPHGNLRERHRALRLASRSLRRPSRPADPPTRGCERERDALVQPMLDEELHAVHLYGGSAHRSASLKSVAYRGVLFAVVHEAVQLVFGGVPSDPH
jgi:hypothetical protein